MNEFTLDDDGDSTDDVMAILDGNAPSSATVQQLLLDERKTLPDKVKNALAKVNDSTIALPQRLEIISNVITAIVPIVVAESLADAPNVKRSIVMSRMLMTLKGAADVLARKHQIEQTDDLNPYSPKFAMAFGWFMDIFHNVLNEQLEEVDGREILINNIFAGVGSHLIGWEDKLEKRLKGVSGRALDQLQNPFIKEFTDTLKALPATTEAPTIEG